MKKDFLIVVIVIFMVGIMILNKKTENVSKLTDTPKEAIIETKSISTNEEIINKVKEEVIAELKKSEKKSVNLKNSMKLKYKLVDDSKDRVYTLMYYRDLTSRHNVGLGYEYTDSKIDKRAILVEYTYKF